MSEIVTRTLACGMPLLVERLGAARSAAVAWLLPAGVATDPDDRVGMSALWSEMLLRGAGKFSSRDHADAFDRLGASRSADVGTYYLTVSATMLGSRLGEALPRLVEMVREPRFDADALPAAQDLATQAIESLSDDPQQRTMIAARAGHHPPAVGRSALGTIDGIAACTIEDVRARWTLLARPSGSIFAAAGDVDPDVLASALDRLLDGWRGDGPRTPYGARPTRGYAHLTEDSNQVQVVVKSEAPPESHPDARLERMMVNVLSGGMSGRLFTEVREKRGLCYAVSAGFRGERDFGATTAYVGTTPERAQQSLDVLMDQLAAMAMPGGRITEDEMARAVIGAKSRLVFAGESTSARAMSLATDFHKLGRARSLGEMAAEIDSVTLPMLNDYLTRRRPGTPTIRTLGPATLTPPAGVPALAG